MIRSKQSFFDSKGLALSAKPFIAFFDSLTVVSSFLVACVNSNFQTIVFLSRGYHKTMLNMQEKNECFANHRNLKVIYKKQKPQLSSELKERIESWIKNIPKIIKNPNISWYIEGGQTYYHCAHPPKNESDLPIPYSQKELDTLNEIEKYPYLLMGYPKSEYCLYCHDKLRNNKEKTCGYTCKCYKGKKNMKRRELEADMIFWGKDLKGKNFQRLTYFYKHKIKNKMKHHSIIIDIPTRNRNTIKIV